MPRPLLPLLLSLQLASLSSDRWQTDLSALARELPSKHQDAFHTISREQFEDAVRALSVRIPSLAPHAVAVELARLVAMIGDGHTELQLLQPALGFHSLPLVFYQYAEGLHVIAADARFKELLGARVSRIGRHEAADAFAAVTPLLSGDTDIEHLHAAPTYLASPEILSAVGIIDGVSQVPIEVITRDGQRRSVTLPAAEPPAAFVPMREAAGVPNPLATSKPGVLYWFERLPDVNATYFQINASMDQDGRPPLARITREMFTAFDAARSAHLIIDVRYNNGGNIARNQELISGIAGRPALREKGRLFIITGRRTFSAGVDLVMEARRVASPILVGESPRGLAAKPGNRETFRLPNSKIVIDYSEKIDSAAFRASQRRPIPVDISAPPLFTAAIAGRDPPLDAVIRFLKETR